MKILFISRAYPPVVGGIETQNFELYNWLSKLAEIKLIANTRGKVFLPFFLPYAIFRAIISGQKYDALLLGDGVLAVAGWFYKTIHKKPVIMVVHGLDLTYGMRLYQKIWVGKFTKKIDKFVAVGNETLRIAVQKGLPSEKIFFIPNGVDPEKFIGSYMRGDLAQIIGKGIEGKKILLTSGRLARRKGVAWFVENVMPKLDDSVIYVVAGDGSDKENISAAVEKCGLQNRVIMLGYVPDGIRNVLFNTCDLFIQPNIRVPGDIEGFGISVIEAASCRLTVIASRLEGLKDAIKDGENGILVEPYDAGGFIRKINEFLSDDAYRHRFGEKARQYIINNYSWDRISREYLEEIKRTIAA